MDFGASAGVDLHEQTINAKRKKTIISRRIFKLTFYYRYINYPNLFCPMTKKIEIS